MNIGDAAKKSGVSAKMIRHYESINLVPKATRTSSGYRVYSDSDVHTLSFVKRARTMGFDMKEIKRLVSLWRNKNRSSADVKVLAEKHVAMLEAKIAELAAMKDILRHLIHCCHGDKRPECPILDEMGRQR